MKFIERLGFFGAQSSISVWTWIYDYLAGCDPVTDADLIFTLAGRQGRKIYAVELFSQQRAKQILLSVGRFEIRRFSELDWPTAINLLQLAAPVPPPKRHFFVWGGESSTEAKLIRKASLGTWSEVRALADWLPDHPEVKSVLIISSACHLRRVRLCCLALLPEDVEFRLIAAKDEGYDLKPESWWRQRSGRAVVLPEIGKLLFYWLYTHLPRFTRLTKEKGLALNGKK